MEAAMLYTILARADLYAYARRCVKQSIMKYEYMVFLTDIKDIL